MTERIEQIYDQVVAEEKLKDGTKYERLTAIVFKILDGSGLVVHDVKLSGDGKEASHQIDVSAGYHHMQRRVLVECKDYASESVGIDVIRDINGALALFTSFDSDCSALQEAPAPRCVRWSRGMTAPGP